MVHLLWGRDRFRAKRFTDAAIKEFVAAHPRAVMSIFRQGDTAFQDAVRFAAGAGLFSETKAVIFWGDKEFKKELAERKKDIAGIAADPNTLFIIWAPTKSEFLASFFSIRGLTHKEFAPLKNAALIQWTHGIAQELGVRLAPYVAEWLIRVSSGDSWCIFLELEKFANFKPGGLVTLKDAGQLSYQAPQPQFFSLVEALLSRERKLALEALFEELARGGDPLIVLASLTNTFRTILLLRAANHTRQKAVLLQETNPYWLSKLHVQSRALTDSEIRRGFQRLALIDWYAKSGRYDIVPSLEQFIVLW